jgi:serine/threonine-protein kinase
VVYLAERADGKFSQQVALKVVQAGIGASARERFERERRILAGLVHPNIALLYDGGELDDGQAFYTMEYVDGVPITLFCVEADLDIEARCACCAPSPALWRSPAATWSCIATSSRLNIPSTTAR